MRIDHDGSLVGQRGFDLFGRDWRRHAVGGHATPRTCAEVSGVLDDGVYLPGETFGVLRPGLLLSGVAACMGVVRVDVEACVGDESGLGCDADPVFELDAEVTEPPHIFVYYMG